MRNRCMIDREDQKPEVCSDYIFCFCNWKYLGLMLKQTVKIVVKCKPVCLYSHGNSDLFDENKVRVSRERRLCALCSLLSSRRHFSSWQSRKRNTCSAGLLFSWCSVVYNESTIQGLQSVTKHSDSTTKWWIHHILDDIVISDRFCLLAVLFPVYVNFFTVHLLSLPSCCCSVLQILLIFIFSLVSLRVFEFECSVSLPTVWPITVHFTTFTPVTGWRPVSLCVSVFDQDWDTQLWAY